MSLALRMTFFYSKMLKKIGDDSFVCFTKEIEVEFALRCSIHELAILLVYNICSDTIVVILKMEFGLSSIFSIPKRYLVSSIFMCLN